jgi:hypothetical protein
MVPPGILALLASGLDRRLRNRWRNSATGADKNPIVIVWEEVH